jgi:hypothetical protein
VTAVRVASIHLALANDLWLRVIGVLLQSNQPLFAATESEVQMGERLETLKKARERMTDDRDAFAKILAAPFDRDKAERARIKFIETQLLIDALDRAIAGEQNRPAAAA